METKPRFFVVGNTDGIGLSQSFIDAVADIIYYSQYSKVGSVKLLRNLQFQPANWQDLSTNSVMGLLDAKNIVEFVADHYDIKFV